jgi:hypothetical protein
MNYTEKLSCIACNETGRGVTGAEKAEEWVIPTGETKSTGGAVFLRI